MTISGDKHSAIYSFRGKWLRPIIEGRIKVFFRRRFPREAPDRIYFYVGAPTSAIIGWAQVTSLQRVEATVALSMATDGAIEKRELAEYLEGAQSVGVFELGAPNMFRNPLSVSDVRKIFNFHPPQNFVQIHKEDASALDELAK